MQLVMEVIAMADDDSCMRNPCVHLMASVTLKASLDKMGVGNLLFNDVSLKAVYWGFPTASLQAFHFNILLAHQRSLKMLILFSVLEMYSLIGSLLSGVRII